MATATSSRLDEAESSLHSAESESDPSRRSQFAQAALDSAAEVAWDSSASVEDRANARAIMRSSLKLRVQSVQRRRFARGQARGLDERGVEIL